MRRFMVWGVVLGGMALLAGCGQKEEGAGASGGAISSPYDTGPRAAESPVDETLAQRGEELFKTKTCSTCHGFGVRITGPDLKGVTQRRSADWMEQQMLRPEFMTKEDPIARSLLGEYAVQMPNLMLKPQETKALIEFLKHQDKQMAQASQ